MAFAWVSNFANTRRVIVSSNTWSGSDLNWRGVILSIFARKSSLKCLLKKSAISGKANLRELIES
jgi:hypothetical protein